MGIGMLHPLLGEVIAVAEIVVVLTVTAVALFGSQALSERAFRLLRWFGNRANQRPLGDGRSVRAGRRRKRREGPDNCAVRTSGR